VFGWFTLAFLVFAQWYAIATSPADRDMGDLQKILYVHVPASWIMSITFALVFVYSLLYLWKGKDSYDLLAASSAEVGATFVGLTLVQGMIWGKPTWGVWWTWDARLTSTLVLFLVFVGYLALRAFIDEPQRRGQWSAAGGGLGAPASRRYLHLGKNIILAVGFQVERTGLLLGLRGGKSCHSAMRCGESA